MSTGQLSTGQLSTGQLSTGQVQTGRTPTATGRVSASATVPGLIVQQPGVAPPPASPQTTSRVYGRAQPQAPAYPDAPAYPEVRSYQDALAYPATAQQYQPSVPPARYGGPDRSLVPVSSAPPVSPAMAPGARPKSKPPRRGLLIGGIVGVVVVVLMGVGAYLFLRDSGSTDPFPVGSCVKQSGSTAVAARCTDAGAFTVVAQVSSVDECTDKAQPYLQLSGTAANRILCLAPAAGSGGPGPSGSPSPGATPTTD